jgi:hypothetical protein
MATEPWYGTEGSDLKDGGPDDDTFFGLGGNDQLRGFGGNDLLDGGAGNDFLVGGDGLDTLTGGTGADTFQDTMAGLNGDHITDFLIGDRIQITDLTDPNIQVTATGINYAGDSVTIDGLGIGRLIVRPLQGSGYEIRLQSLAHNDFTGDGRSDILWTDGNSVVDWLGGDNGSFVRNYANSVTSLPAGWAAVGTGDFNGDGHIDVLLRNVDGTVKDWLGGQNGSFTDNAANSTRAVPTDWSVVGTGDFNGDGHSDILWRNSAGTITDWLGTDNGGFTANWANFAGNVPNVWQVAGTGDFNGDGRDDILWRNTTTGTITDFVANETDGFTDNYANAAVRVPTDWSVIGTGDFNGDGLTDLLWRNGTTVTDWLGNSNGGFTANWSNFNRSVPTSWHVAGTGDYNGDGVDDLLWRGSDGTITNWLGTGTGSFTDNWTNAHAAVTTNWHVVGDAFLP